MPKPPSPRSAYGVGWPANRRIAIVALALAVLMAIAAGVAFLTGRGEQHPDHPTATSSSSPPAPAPDRSTKAGSVPKPPQTAEPVAYAKAAAKMLWSYDTRDTRRSQQLDGMQAWMTGEAKYADWASVSGQIPDPVLWSRMADQDQHATGTAAEGHFPNTFKQALADDPSAITQAYVYVVTVNGKQKIAWKKHGGGAEKRAITLAVQCRPHHDCSLAAIAPRVAP
ncbi:hypothetical protein [Streptomyces sp. NPDC055299]